MDDVNVSLTPTTLTVTGTSECDVNVLDTNHSIHGRSGRARRGSGTWRSGLPTNFPRRISHLLFGPKTRTPTCTDESASCSTTCHATISPSGFGLSTRCLRRSSRWPVRRSSQGGYFLTETILDAAITAGIKVDVTAEPGLPPKTTDPSFGAYATAPSGDFRDCPRRPYYPSRDRLAVPSSSLADARPILIVPLTAYDYMIALQSWPRRFAKRLFGRPRHHLR